MFFFLLHLISFFFPVKQEAEVERGKKMHMLTET